METAADAERAKCGIVLFCVKTRWIRRRRGRLPHLTPEPSSWPGMQNGVDNVERIREACGIDALGAAVYVAKSRMPAQGW